MPGVEESARPVGQGAVREPGGRIIVAAAAASASGALALAACCVLPFALPAIVMAGSGGIIAWLMGAQDWILALAFLAVAGGWFWIGWQSFRRKARPERSLLGVMGGRHPAARPGGRLACDRAGTDPAVLVAPSPASITEQELSMHLTRLSGRDLLKAVGIGIATALILSAIMIPAFHAGLPPMPKPPILAFAEAILGPGLPLPVGLLLHVIYVTFWSIAFIALFRARLTFLRAAALALALWVVALVAFFPINGWGLLGLGIGPTLIPAALVPHVLFAVVLWGLCRLVFGTSRKGKSQ
jgi:hypothetical protein